ncbi:Metallo-dependent phosphatase-like protein [Gongronella butleri]|nr:Metallo-dependent phosphatase-like protein [Gongronella butleri]
MIPFLLLCSFLLLCTSPFVYARRIVAVGDLHGDLANTRKTFQFAGLIDENDKWVGKDTVFVQTGDVVDRGTDTIALYDLIQRMRDEAPRSGGEVIALLGNHEVMNLAGDWRYVTRADIDTFGGYDNRVKAFQLDGFIGGYLAQLNMTAMVDRNVFCHGGIVGRFAEMGVDQINRHVHEDLADYVETHRDPHGVFGGEGPTWFRGWAQDDEPAVCHAVDEALAALDADRMIMGHTPQRTGKITSRCDGKILLVDIGLSWVYGGHAGALEIDGKTLTGLYQDGRVDLTPHKKAMPVHHELR